MKYLLSSERTSNNVKYIQIKQCLLLLADSVRHTLNLSTFPALPYEFKAEL